MKYLKIFLLYFQNVGEQRARCFVWFLLSLFGPLVLILFWRGAKFTNGITFSEITTYYLFFIIAGALLMSHIEDDVARLDIQEGGLVSFILKPFSYYWTRLFSEIPWRIFQGFFGIITLILCLVLFHIHLSITHSLLFILLGIISSFFAYILSFTFKMSLGLLAFWMTDIIGLFQFSDMVAFIFAGYVLPIYFFPTGLQITSYILPFAYMIYFPIALFQEKMSIQQSLLLLSIQFFWVIVFYFIYQFLWIKGLYKFSGVGQ